MKKHLRLATRESKLALWQAQHVQKQLKAIGVTSELVLVKSAGDLLQKQPVQTLNRVGIFTKAIDDAVLEGRADAGVHSYKDLPTEIHKKLTIGAVLKRADAHDVLVLKDEDFFKNVNGKAIIATGSARRRAQWLNKFPHHQIVPVRGNVDTRLQKLQDSNWDGMILAAAGLKRLKIKTLYKKLPWMISAPAQGAIVVVSRKGDKLTKAALERLNHEETYYATLAERIFLDTMDGGCTAPIGAYAKEVVPSLRARNERGNPLRKGKTLLLKAEILSSDGKEKINVELSDKLENAMRLGKQVAKEAMKRGARKLLKK